MKTHLLSLLAGMALLTSVGIAQASEPMALSENQMDQVTAGQNTLKIDHAQGLHFVYSNGTKLDVGSADNLMFTF